MLLPAFPLPMVLFPGERTRLYIFEPRYKRLIRDMLDYDSAFAIPAFIHNTFQGVGAEVRVEKILQEYTGGELDVEVECTSVFRNNPTHPHPAGKLYDEVTIARHHHFGDVMDEQCSLLFETLNQKLRYRYEIPGTGLTICQIAQRLNPDQATRLRLLKAWNNDAVAAVLRNVLRVELATVGSLSGRPRELGLN